MDDWVTVTSANQLVRGRGYFVCWRKKQSNNCKNNRISTTSITNKIHTLRNFILLFHTTHIYFTGMLLKLNSTAWGNVLSTFNPISIFNPNTVNNGVNQIKITTPNYPSNNLDKKPFTTSNMNIPSVQLLSNPLNIIPSPFAKQRQTGKVHLKISPEKGMGNS